MYHATTPLSTTPRDDYKAITLNGTPAWVTTLIRDAERTAVFTTGIGTRNSRGNRGTAINTALYGYDEAQGLAVIQVREAIFHPRRFTRVRKDYYLLGRTEDTEVFAHPIESPVRSKRAMASPEACVAWVLSKIWRCDIDEIPLIRRQGDIAFIPDTLPADAHPEIYQEFTIRDSHIILATRIWRRGSEFWVSREAQARHTKGEHATYKGARDLPRPGGNTGQSVGLYRPSRRLGKHQAEPVRQYVNALPDFCEENLR